MVLTPKKSGNHQSAVHGMVTANSASVGMPPMRTYTRRRPSCATAAAVATSSVG